MSEKLSKKFVNMSPANFAISEYRQAMDAAIKKVRGELGRSYRLKDGAVLSQRAAQSISSLNPSQTTEVVGYVEMADVTGARQALDEVFEASKSFRKTSVVDRAELLEKLAEWMEARRYELAAWMVFEVGKNWREADADVCEAVDFCRFYARQALRLCRPTLTQEVAGELNELMYLPKGVGLVIAPWNFPLAIMTGMTVASWVCGNATIFKPAEQSSVIACLLAQGMKEVGFPENSFYLLPGEGRKIGPPLVEDERVDVIAFTGSASVGLSIIEQAAKKPGAHQRGVKKVIAEMGGKNALIIDEDADIDEAVVGALHSAFGFQGQKCSALSRLLVHSNVYESFVERFVEAAKSLRVGSALNPECQVGPVIDEEAQQRILKTISEAKSRLKTLYVSEDLPSGGWFVPPSIFVVDDIQDDLFQNEVFGPVVAVKRVESLDQAISEANSVRYALTGGVYSRSPSHIEKVKREMEVGNLYINRSITGAVVERQPFGGYKLSGVGSKAGGVDYLIQYLEPRTITENTVRRGFAG